MKKNTNKGFTLIEILVVIGIIAILATIVLIAINPARQFKQANDTQRTANVNAILNAIGQYTVDNKGSLPSGISSSAKEIGSAVTQVDICDDLVPLYIPNMPVDPENTPFTGCPASYSTGYEVEKDTNGRVTVTAPNTEIASPDISVTR